MSKADFHDFKVSFTCVKDPVTNAPINLNFNKSDFAKVPEDFGLFKIAARDQLNSNNLSHLSKVELSKKYQVLCNETAFVGVVKQKDKVSGEMMQFAVEFGKSI